MMASLADIIQKRRKESDLGEPGLEQGKIFVFTPATHEANYFNSCFCWSATGNGLAVVEIWGAAGSSARQCCCSANISGNPGAYSKKTVCVQSGDWIRGIVGMACGYSTDCHIWFRGCSESTCITLCTNLKGCECMCAEGGKGGHSMCVQGSNVSYCCFRCDGFATSLFKVRCNCNICCSVPNMGCYLCCGIICNIRPGSERPAIAYGGDINKEAGISCLSVYKADGGGDGGGNCRMVHHVHTSPGIISEDGVMLTIPHGGGSSSAPTAGGHALHAVLNAVASAGKRPSLSGHYYTEQGCLRFCGCYEMMGCLPFLPPGIPGPGSGTNGDVRDHGLRGGPGLVRIKFIGN